MDLKASLCDPALLRADAYMDGEWTGTERRFAVSDPATGAHLADVADLTPVEAERIILAAQAAGTAWAARTAKDRSDLISRWADLMMGAQDDLALILTSEMGKPLTEAKGKIAYGASFLY